MNLTSWLRGTLVCLVATLFCTYQFMIQGSPSLMVPDLVNQLSLNLTQIGFVSSAFLYAYLLFQVPGGMLADRFSVNRLLAITSLMMAMSVFGFALARNYEEALMARAMMGVSTSPVIVACMTLVGRWFPERLFPVFSGLVESTALMGGALGPILLPELIDTLGWRESMQYLALAGVVLAGIIFVIVKDHPESSPEESKQQAQSRYQWSLLLNNRDFWLCCLYGFGVFVIINSFAALWGVPFLHQRFPENADSVHEAISLMFIGAAVGAPSIGLIAALTRKSLLVMKVSAVILLGLTIVAFFTECTMGGMCCYCFGIGVFSGSYMLVFSLVRNLIAKPMQGVAMAIANGFMLSGGPMVQPLIGSLLVAASAESLESLSVENYQLSFLVIIACQIFAFFCISKVGRRTG